jgi:hypothetical protein
MYYMMRMTLAGVIRDNPEVRAFVYDANGYSNKVATPGEDSGFVEVAVYACFYQRPVLLFYLVEGKLKADLYPAGSAAEGSPVGLFYYGQHFQRLVPRSGCRIPTTEAALRQLLGAAVMPVASPTTTTPALDMPPTPGTTSGTEVRGGGGGICVIYTDGL